MVGKAIENGRYFHRIDTTAFPDIPKTVKYRLSASAGLLISFTTNSSIIEVDWHTSGRKQNNNHTEISHSGMDLYILQDDHWVFAGVARPTKPEGNVYRVVQFMEGDNKDCLLYLPLHDETTSLRIGVEEQATLIARPNPFKKKILVYGSSIVHGASASRPGLAYPARLSRETSYDFINFGMSGSAKMEKSVGDMIAAMPMDAFILDCVPNASPAQITERTKTFVETIRKKNPEKPIIAIQSIAHAKGNFNVRVNQYVAAQNENFKREISRLQVHDKHLYLIEARDLIGEDDEGTVDGTHPNDLGFNRFLRRIKPKILEILNRYKI